MDPAEMVMAHTFHPEGIEILSPKPCTLNPETKTETRNRNQKSPEILKPKRSRCSEGMDPAEMIMAHKFHPEMYTKRSALSSLCAAATKTFCKVRIWQI
jgi:hypothetical protein